MAVTLKGSGDCDVSKRFACPECKAERFIEYTLLDNLEGKVDFSCPDCGEIMKCLPLGPRIGFAPWQPFDSEVLGGSFPTRESYKRYCKEHNLHQLTTKEIKEEKVRAKQLKWEKARREGAQA